jgi:DNA-binding protein Fis
VLINYFLLKYRHEKGVRISKVTAPTVNYLVNYSWPGNTRELEQTLRRALPTCKSNLLRIENVDWLYDREEESTETPQPAAQPDKPDQLNENTLAIPAITSEDFEDVYETVISKSEKSLFEQILQRCGGNVRKAARQLGISRTTLRTKIEKYDLGDMTRKRLPKNARTGLKKSENKPYKPVEEKPKPFVHAPLKIRRQSASPLKKDSRKKSGSKTKSGNKPQSKKKSQPRNKPHRMSGRRKRNN